MQFFWNKYTKLLQVNDLQKFQKKTNKLKVWDPKIGLLLSQKKLTWLLWTFRLIATKKIFLLYDLSMT